MGKFVGIAIRIIEHVPFAINMVERMLGGSSGAVKKAAAAREVFEFVVELVEDNPAEEWDEIEAIDKKQLLAAVADEKEFVSKISAVNDALVDLVNFVNSKS